MRKVVLLFVMSLCVSCVDEPSVHDTTQASCNDADPGCSGGHPIPPEPSASEHYEEFLTLLPAEGYTPDPTEKINGGCLDLTCTTKVNVFGWIRCTINSFYDTRWHMLISKGTCGFAHAIDPKTDEQPGRDAAAQ